LGIRLSNETIESLAQGEERAIQEFLPLIRSKIDEALEQRRFRPSSRSRPSSRGEKKIKIRLKKKSKNKYVKNLKEAASCIWTKLGKLGTAKSRQVQQGVLLGESSKQMEAIPNLPNHQKAKRHQLFWMKWTRIR
jgi:hypothetical protein